MTLDSQLITDIFEKRVRVKSHQVKNRVTEDSNHHWIQLKPTESESRVLKSMHRTFPNGRILNYMRKNSVRVMVVAVTREERTKGGGPID